MNVIAWLIVACEIGFWIVITLGLLTRYILKKNKLGLFFLALTPVIDLILLVVTGVDLYRG
ncbi:membrane protein, partial [Bacillus thuringiensis]|nr:membrane protein [Bacillus thuringiensis]